MQKIIWVINENTMNNTTSQFTLHIAHMHTGYSHGNDENDELIFENSKSLQRWILLHTHMERRSWSEWKFFVSFGCNKAQPFIDRQDVKPLTPCVYSNDYFCWICCTTLMTITTTTTTTTACDSVLFYCHEHTSWLRFETMLTTKCFLMR